jgi:hypothetical protein
LPSVICFHFVSDELRRRVGENEKVFARSTLGDEANLKFSSFKLAETFEVSAPAHLAWKIDKTRRKGGCGGDFVTESSRWK